MNKVFYLCDGEVPECTKTHCYKREGEAEPCRHTTNVAHAINFRQMSKRPDAAYYENDQSK
mgnify:FL=1